MARKDEGFFYDVQRSGASARFDGRGVEFEACKEGVLYFPSAAEGLFLLRPGM